MSSELTFGLYNNNLIHISEAKNGKACECTCPHCKSKLIARQGKEKSWCFAHENTEECGYAQESALHKFAKDVLAKYLKMKVPSPSVGKYKDDYILFDRVELEKRLDDIVPDVILYKGQPPNENILLVEIKVTHPVDEVKLNKIKSANISTIEIDLSRIDYKNFNKESVENIIINSIYNKRWVFNKKIKGKSIEVNEYPIDEFQEDVKIKFTEHKDVKMNSDKRHEFIRKNLDEKEMSLSLLLEKYRTLKSGTLLLSEGLEKYKNENSVICYVSGTNILRPEPNLCENNNCMQCGYFINKISLYDFIENTCYMAIKCRNSSMKMSNIINLITKKIKDEKIIPFITKEDLIWIHDKKYNYEKLEILYGIIFSELPLYSNNLLCVKDKFNRFEPIPNLCGMDRCGKWCKNFLSIQEIKRQYLSKDIYVYICKCNHENTRRDKINEFIGNQIRFFRQKNRKKQYEKIRKQQSEEGNRFREYLINNRFK